MLCNLSLNFKQDICTAAQLPDAYITIEKAHYIHVIERKHHAHWNREKDGRGRVEQNRGCKLAGAPCLKSKLHHSCFCGVLVFPLVIVMNDDFVLPCAFELWCGVLTGFNLVSHTI